MENELEARVTEKIKELQNALAETNLQLRRVISFLPQLGSSSFVRKTDSIDHSILTGSTTGDPHTQYLLLAGRVGGQTTIGGTAAGDDLTLQTTSHATKGSYIFSEMTSAGYLMNSAAGVVTGGNTISTPDTYPVGIMVITDGTTPEVLGLPGTWEART